MRHMKPRFRLRNKVNSLRRRRKVVELLAGADYGKFHNFRKRNPIKNRADGEENAGANENNSL
jgi:hypothetical protein